MLKFFRLPFATTGDKTAVPDAVDSNGNVSYSQGYGFDYQRQKTDPAAKNIERNKMNQILFDITTAIAEIQSQGVPDYITSALNGGAPFGYAQYAVVRYLGELYISLTAANTTLPTDPVNWAPFSAVLRGLGVTPPQFDNDTSIATTAFVQRALGNFSQIRAITSATTLTADDVGRFITCGIGGYSVTLPAASSATLGSSIYFQATTGPVTISRAGGDLISFGDGTTGNSIVLNTGDSLFVTRGSSTSWAAIGGSSQLKYAAAFGSSLAANGYQKLPSGLIVQWGKTQYVNVTGGVIAFPIAFPNACLSVAVNVSELSGNYAFGQAVDPSVNNFTSVVYTASPGFAPLGNTSTTVDFYWTAVGR